MTHDTIKTHLNNHVGVLTLYRPDALNALNQKMMHEVQSVISDWDKDINVRAIVITGSEKSFAAGVDIKEMLVVTYLDARDQQFLDGWTCIAKCRTPTIAAVAGYALGGGCEIAMMCDFILCADNARFGQPETSIGTIPGLGGTQRLTRLVGKSKAMEMCITGRIMNADEAERAGLVSRIVPLAKLQDEALQVAAKIAGYSASAVSLAREAVEASCNTTLEQGLAIERQSFYSLFGTDDQIEGMSAFTEKRAAKFSR